MAVLQLRQPLKRMAGDAAEHRFDATTVAGVLRGLESEHAELRGWILDERGELRRHISVFVNGEPAELSSLVDAEDRIDILPAISGG